MGKSRRAGAGAFVESTNVMLCPSQLLYQFARRIAFAVFAQRITDTVPCSVHVSRALGIQRAQGNRRILYAGISRKESGHDPGRDTSPEIVPLSEAIALVVTVDVDIDRSTEVWFYLDVHHDWRAWTAGE